MLLFRVEGMDEDKGAWLIESKLVPYGLGAGLGFLYCG
jgi:hypothetical protein